MSEEVTPTATKIESPSDDKPRLLSPLFRRIPLTKEYMQWLDSLRDAKLAERQAEDDKLKLLDEELKRKFKFEFSYGAKALAETSAWITAIQNYLDRVVVVLLILVPIVTPPLIGRFIIAAAAWAPGSWRWLGIQLLISAGTAGLAFLILVLPIIPFAKTSPKADQFFNLNAMLLVWAALMFVAASLYDYRLEIGRLVSWPPFLRSHATVYFINQLGGIPVLILLLALLYRFVSKSMEKKKQEIHTRAVVVDELLSVLAAIDTANYGEPGSSWPELSHRRALCDHLETVASCFENYFSGYFLTAAPEMNRWTDQATTEIASGVRELIKKLITSGPHSALDFKEHVIKYFWAALSSEWGQFDRLSVQKVSRREGMRTRLTSGITAVVTAAVPVLLLFLLRRWHLVNEPLLTYVTVGAYIWAALSLLSQVDPQYSGKIAAFKDITSAL